MRAQRLRFAAIALICLAGMTIGHALVYVSVPTAHPMTAALVGAGHHPWIIPWQAVPIAFVVAVGVYATGSLANRAVERRWIASRLLLLQSLGFVLLEAAERAVTAEVTVFAAEPVIVLGLAVQALVALALAAILDLSRATVSRLRRSSPARSRHAAAVVTPVTGLLVVLLRPGRGMVGFRAPPSAP
jgi:hypothetical protein